MSSGRIAQHRNYGELMARHEKEVRIKRIIKLFIYFLIIAFMIIVFIIVNRIQQKKSTSPKTQSGYVATPRPDHIGGFET
jgi:large-conductance mechanosensitive channel